jgi:hypothetical protein
MHLRVLFGLAVATLLIARPGAARAQQCEDYNQCTVNDMCREGVCSGTPASGSGCNDFNDCTVNDRCGPDGECVGDPAPLNTSCSGGCGTCQAFVPIPDVPLQCLGDPANAGRSCDTSSIGPCLQGACQMFGGVPGFPAVAVCIPRQLECPASGNCKGACNPATSQCDNSLSRCFGDCERCDQGQCVPANQGRACDDFNPCTAQSKCDTFEFGNEVRGACIGGVPSGELPTPTPIEQEPTPTVPPSGGCTGDCNGDREVTINELIIGVNIALGSAQLTQCPSFDRSGDGEVAINELIQGVNAALGSCDG